MTPIHPRHEGKMSEREAFRRQAQLIARAWAEMARSIAEAVGHIVLGLREPVVDAEVAVGSFPERYAEALGEDEWEVFV